MLNPHTALFIKAAQKLGVGYRIVNPPTLVRFTKNGKSTLIYRTQIEANALIPSLLCLSKYQTNLTLWKAKLPVPKQLCCLSAEDALTAVKEIGFPLVVKPLKGLGGKYVTVNMRSETELKQAVKHVLKEHHSFVVEKYCRGKDYRFLILNGKVIGIVKREPPTVRGNGKQTIREYLEKYNPKLPIDMELRQTLKRQGLNVRSVPQKGQTVKLRKNTNIATGADSTTVADNTIHPDLRLLAIEAVNAMGMSLAGVDMLIKNPKEPRKNNAVILEINSQPGIDIILNIHAVNKHHGVFCPAEPNV